MMTKRSYHMPALTNWQTMKTTIQLLRILLNQKICGERTLHVIMQ